MQKLILTDVLVKDSFYPISLTKHVADIKCGFLSIREKWETLAKSQHLELQVIRNEEAKDNTAITVPANRIPSPELDLNIFFNSPEIFMESSVQVENLWDAIKLNQSELIHDMSRLGLQASDLSAFPQIKATLVHPIYIGNHVDIEHCFINTKDGPVFIDDHALVMEGTMLRGPLYIGKKAVVKMGTCLYQGTSIGEHCIVGGEMKNTILHGFTNKSHHGYIGDSYLGEWCNLGAGTTCSNLKNTAGKIQAWDHQTKGFSIAGNKAGVLMGDHVKTAINMLMNSGTVIGPFSNVFGTTDPIPKFVPAFTWNLMNKERYELDKLMSEINRWMAIKGRTIESNVESLILKLFYNQL